MPRVLQFAAGFLSVLGVAWAALVFSAMLVAAGCTGWNASVCATPPADPAKWSFSTCIGHDLPDLTLTDAGLQIDMK